MKLTNSIRRVGIRPRSAGLPDSTKLSESFSYEHRFYRDEPLLHSDTYTFVVVDRLEDGTVDTIKYLHRVKGAGVPREGTISYYPGCLIDQVV